MKCKICYSDNVNLLHLPHLYDINGVDQTSYRLYKCTDCSFTFTNPVPSLEEFSHLYQAGVYSRHRGIMSNLFGSFFSITFKYVIKNLIKSYQSINLTTPNTLLDVGCGKGRFLSACEGLIPNVYGQEPFCSQSNHFYNQKIKVYNLPLDAIPVEGGFDIITMWHVLEHVDDVSKLLIDCNKIISNNGLLVFEIPNFASFQAILGQGLWFHLDVPRHLNFFSYKPILKLLKDNNFNIIKYSTFSIGLGYFSMLQTLFNYLPVRKQLLFRILKRDIHPTFFEFVIIFLATIPLSIISFAVESISLLFNAGGILRIVAAPLPNEKY